MSKELKEKIDLIFEKDLVEINNVVDDARNGCFDGIKKEYASLGYYGSMPDVIDRLCNNMFEHERTFLELVIKFVRDQVMEAIEEEERTAVDDGK